MEYGVAFASELDSWRWVKRAEELGFAAAWFYDTQLLNPDVFICMALAAKETERIRLGTGVLVPSNRIEPVTANALATLNRLAPGRIDFGVGTGFTARRTMGLTALTLERTRTYIQRVQALVKGEIVDWDFEGKDRKIGFLNPDLGLINVEDDIPLYVSAFGPRSRELVAEMNAGWLNFGAGVALQGINDMRATWTEAGRKSEDLQAGLFFLGAVLTGDAADHEKMMRQAAPQTAVLFHNLSDDHPGPRPPAGSEIDRLHQEYLKLHDGYEPADAKYLRNHRGHLMFVRDDEAPLLSEDLIRATTLTGTFDELVERIREFEQAGYTQMIVQLVHGEENALEEWAEVFKAV